MTLADDPFAELTAQINLADGSSAPNTTGSAGGGTRLNLAVSSSASATGSARVAASLYPLGMFDAPRQAPRIEFTAGAQGEGKGAAATGYSDPFLAATAGAVVAHRPPGPLPAPMFQKVLALASASEAPGPVSSNNLRLCGGFAGDDVWRVILGEGLLATSLSFSELTRLGRLNRSSRRLHDATWRAIWRARSKTCGGAELERILRLSVTLGKADHVRELMAEQGDTSVLLQALHDQPSLLFLAVKARHVEVVRALLEVGGRELAMMTRGDGASCLYISAEEGHLDMVKALLEAGGRELMMLTKNDGDSCLSISAREGHLDVVKALLEGGGRELVLLTRDDGASCLLISAH